MLFVVEVIVVQVEEHFGSGGGGDSGADDALHAGQLGKQFWPLCAGGLACLRLFIGGRSTGLLEEL